MTYSVVFNPQARREVASWGLPDGVLVEMYLRAAREIAASPTSALVRSPPGEVGMLYPFEMIDPGNRLRVHRCLLTVVYGRDEEAIFVVRGSYVQTFGFG